MELCRCPICHSRIHLEALIQDDAGRELFTLIAKMPEDFTRALIPYMSLFRSANRDLANDKALRLAQEIVTLGEPHALAIALAETTEAIRSKQLTKPLKNHNYLKQVLESVQARMVARPTMENPPRRTFTSKTGQGLAALEELKHG